MKGSTEVVKDRIEEAAGAPPGNDKLRTKGQTDQTVGRVKQAAEKGVRQAKESARKIGDKARNIALDGGGKVKRRVVENSDSSRERRPCGFLA